MVFIIIPIVVTEFLQHFFNTKLYLPTKQMVLEINIANTKIMYLLSVGTLSRGRLQSKI